MSTRSSLEVLQRANLRLENFLARFSGVPVLGTNEEVEALLQVERALQSVRPLLGEGLEQSDDRETREELASYRANLVRLQRELNQMQDAALAGRARVFARQRHLQDAQAWCAASRSTQ